MQNQNYRTIINDHESHVNQDTYEFEQGIFRFDKPINEDEHKRFAGFVNYWVRKHPGESMYIIINSPGGHVTDGLAILDTLNSAKEMGCTVYTIATGMAASMGAFLLAAGSKGCRYATPNAKIMLHQPLGGVSGQATDMQIVVEDVVRTKSLLTKHISDFTGQSVEQLAPKLERDYHMSAEQALKEGVIDHIDYEVKIIQTFSRY